MFVERRNRTESIWEITVLTVGLDTWRQSKPRRLVLLDGTAKLPLKIFYLAPPQRVEQLKLAKLSSIGDGSKVHPRAPHEVRSWRNKSFDPFCYQHGVALSVELPHLISAKHRESESIKQCEQDERGCQMAIALPHFCTQKYYSATAGTNEITNRNFI